MANEKRVRANLVSGTLSGAFTNVATSMSAAGLANLPVVDATNHAAITIENEIVWVTAHTGGATTATIVRGQEGTVAAAHNSGVAWQHGPTALDLGGLFFSPPACRVTHGTTQSIAHGADQVLVLNTKIYDTDTMHDTVTNNSRVTIKTAGLYLLTFSGEFPPAADFIMIYSYFRINGVTPFGIGSTGMTTFNGPGVMTGASTVYKFAVNDYVEVLVHHNNGAATARNMNSSANYSPVLTATWIGTGL